MILFGGRGGRPINNEFSIMTYHELTVDQYE